MAAINVTFADPVGDYEAQSAAFVALVQAAWAVWAPYLAEVDVVLDVDLALFSDPNATANGASVTSGHLGRIDGLDTWMQGAAFELLTGRDPNAAAADIRIRVSIERLERDYWINPLDGSPIPSDRSDLLKTFVHELGHALGFTGWRSWTDYALPGDYQSTFDQLMVVANGLPYFTGGNARAVYGGDVPLTAGNVMHLGNVTGPGVDLIDDVMGGVRTLRGFEYRLSPLDVAVLSDTGVPTVLADRLQGSGEADRINAAAGDDTVYGAAGADSLIGGLGNDLLDGGDGQDTAVYAGPMSRYSWTRNGDGSWRVQDSAAAGEGRDILWDIEKLQFADQAVTLPASAFTLSLRALNDTLREGSSGGLTSFVFLVSRGGSLASSATYTYAVSASGAAPASAADFAAGFPTGAVTFAPGQGTAEIHVLVLADDLAEANETFQIAVSNGVFSLQTTATIYNDDVGAGVQLAGGAGAQSLTGGLGNDSLRGGPGDDQLAGGYGRDIAVFDGAAANYDWWRGDDGAWHVRDTRDGSPDGEDRLVSVEVLQFSDAVVQIDSLGHAAQMAAAFQNIMRRAPSSAAETAFVSGLVEAVGFGQKSFAQAYAEIAERADGTTAVAAMTYQFFLGFAPSKAGFDFLVSPTGPNPNNINSAYYQFFNQENRYINFAVNVGAGGEGKAAFQAEFGHLTLRQATALAYQEIFGNAPGQAKLDLLLDAPIGGGLTRKDYLAAYGGDGLEGLGTKAAMVGFLLSAAAIENQGFYARSTAAYFADLADGAQFRIDLIGTYNQPEWAFGG